MSKGESPAERAKYVMDEREICFMLNEVFNEHKKQWVIVSAASSHMANDRDVFDYFEPCCQDIFLADGSVLASSGIGKCKINMFDEQNNRQIISLTGVLYVPNLDSNLISVKKITANGGTVTFKNEKCFIFKEKKCIGISYPHKNMYILKTNFEFVHKIIESGSLDLWHYFLRHRNIKDLNLIRNNNLAEGIKIFGGHIDSCKTCLKGKGHSRLSGVIWPFGKKRLTFPSNMCYT